MLGNRFFSNTKTVVGMGEKTWHECQQILEIHSYMYIIRNDNREDFDFVLLKIRLIYMPLLVTDLASGPHSLHNTMCLTLC